MYKNRAHVAAHPSPTAGLDTTATRHSQCAALQDYSSFEPWTYRCKFTPSNLRAQSKITLEMAQLSDRGVNDLVNSVTSPDFKGLGLGKQH